MAMLDKSILSTRLSIISSKDKEKLAQFIRALPYKIEIKQIQFVKKYEVWYVPPEKLDIQPAIIDLD